MGKVLIEKVVSALPATLEPNTLYIVRVGTGYDMLVTDNDGTLAFKQNTPTHYPSEIRNSGRMYCYNDARWVTNGDDNYGPNYYQFLESGTTAADPVMEWEHQGDILDAGTKIHSARLAFRNIDLANIVDIEIIAVFTSYEGRTEALNIGLDNDNEDVHTILYRGFLKAGGSGLAPITGPFNDKHDRILPLGDFVTPKFGDIRFYFKPVNAANRTNTSTDYVQLTYKWNISIPLYDV